MKKIKISNGDIWFAGLIIIIIVVMSLLMDSNYKKGVEDCSKEHDLKYCESVMRR